MSDSSKARLKKLASYSFVAVLLIIVAAMTTTFFEHFPIEGTTLGIDWGGIWAGVRNGQIHYNTGFRVTPWDVPLLMPLGFLSVGSSWGLIALFTMSVLVLSVPRQLNKWAFAAGIMLVSFSWPALRHLADGNLEGLVIAGVLLLLYGFHERRPVILAIGALVATAKIQEAWLLVIIVGINVLITWKARQSAKAGIVVLLIAVPTFLLLGPTWLNTGLNILERGSLVDISLFATGNRLGIAAFVLAALWLAILLVSCYIGLTTPDYLGRDKAGFLLCASFLLSPYTAGNSMLTILAIGVIPLLYARTRLAILLIGLFNLLALAPTTIAYWSGSSYLTGVLFVAWGVLGWSVMRGWMHATVDSAPITVAVTPA